MSDWIWFIDYRRDTRIVLADRDALGTICGIVGGSLLNASWPWRLHIGWLTHRIAEVLINASERHTRTVTEVPADAAVLDALVRAGADAPESPAAAPSASTSGAEASEGTGEAQEARE